MGGSRFFVAGENECTGILDHTVLVESVENELLNRLRHRNQVPESSKEAEHQKKALR